MNWRSVVRNVKKGLLLMRHPFWSVIAKNASDITLSHFDKHSNDLQIASRKLVLRNLDLNLNADEEEIFSQRDTSPVRRQMTVCILNSIVYETQYESQIKFKDIL